MKEKGAVSSLAMKLTRSLAPTYSTTADKHDKNRGGNVSVIAGTTSRLRGAWP